MVPRKSLILATAMTVFLTFLLVLVGLQARASAQSADSAQAATTASGVDPLAAQQAVEAANRQLEEAARSISQLQQQVVTLQQALKSAYATLDERERHYKALLEAKAGPEAVTLQQQLEVSQSEVQGYKAREQKLTAQITALKAQLDDTYRVLSEREAAYQAQLQEAYAVIQAYQTPNGDALARGDHDGDDHEEHEEHEEHDDH